MIFNELYARRREGPQKLYLVPPFCLSVVYDFPSDAISLKLFLSKYPLSLSDFLLFPVQISSNIQCCRQEISSIVIWLFAVSRPNILKYPVLQKGILYRYPAFCSISSKYPQISSVAEGKGVRRLLFDLERGNPDVWTRHVMSSKVSLKRMLMMISDYHK